MDAEIVRLPDHRRAEAAAVLATAFALDENFRKFFPTVGERYPECVAAHFADGCDRFAAWQFTFLAAMREDRILGIAVVAENGCRYPPLPLRLWHRVQGARNAFRIGLQTNRNMIRYSRATDTLHPDPACSYVGYLGVLPSEQASGIGTALLEAAYERACEHSIGLLLDTVNPNLAKSLERGGWRVRGPLACGPVEGYSCHRAPLSDCASSETETRPR